MEKFLAILLLFISRICSGQNLVPNGDLEQFTSCPTQASQIDSALFWQNPCLPPYGANLTESGSSDYFNSCTASLGVGVPLNQLGYQFPQNGNGYAGIWLFNNQISYREYIEVSLISPLIAGTCYHMEVYVNLANISKYTTDTLGVYFSNIAVGGFHSHDQLRYQPQLKLNSGFILDTLNWTLMSGDYTAIGGESYLTIGNFNNDISTNTYLINSAGLIGAFIYIDNVSLVACIPAQMSELNTDDVNFYPHPIKDYLNVQINNTELTEITIYDSSSRKILQQTFTNTAKINAEHIAKGIYLYSLRNRDGIIKQGKLIKE
jgi:hypothetical protein